jgi:hypothetical protein
MRMVPFETKISETCPQLPSAQARYITGSRFQRRTTMPVLVIPILIGIPVLLGGGYFIIHALHH